MNALLVVVSLAAGTTAPAAYDATLCATAQRIVAGAPQLPVRIQRGIGSGFYTIQMSIDTDAGEAVVAMTTVSASTASGAEPAWVACKMVDRDRVRDMLGFEPPRAAGTCREVNEHTWEVAWSSLTATERQRLEDRGRALRFGPDAVLPSGGEWLPADAADFVRSDAAGIEVRAPSVRVPWDPVERDFFQGTHHCKLVTLASLERWMRSAAFDDRARLWAGAADDCPRPARFGATAGSCLFYFAPVQSMVCQDYSGGGWTPAAARGECGRRHASRADQAAAGNRYEGRGGRFSRRDCAARDDVPERAGTCIFRCGAADETLWHLPAGMTTGPGSAMLDRACDRFVPAARESTRKSAPGPARHGPGAQ